VDKTQNLTQDN